MKIRFENTITAADVHRHIPHAFEVPPGTTEVHMELAYAPRFSAGQMFHNQMSLSVADPAGPRGVYYLLRDYGINITEARCTPGMNAGPVRPGRWLVELDTYRLLPPDPITYTIEVTLSDRPITEPPRRFAKPARKAKGPGWYRGDLHAHSLHSDASWDVPDLVAHARALGHDFQSLTDHNTVSGLPEHESLASDDFMTMGGLELTTYYGHAVVLGTRQWHEWRLDTDRHYTMPELARMAMESGALFIIAHPMNPGDPECSGCHWEFTDMMPGNARAVEIWNGTWGPCNERTVQTLYGWLNEGLRVVATGGTDLHGPPAADVRHGTNVIYADDLTEAAIVAAIRKGHSYLSCGPELLLTARTASGREAINGDSLPPEQTSVTVRWSGTGEGDVLRLIVDGAVHDQRPAGDRGEASWAFATGEAHWCGVELRDADGGMRAIANPIFLDGR
jgi:hypothetical protein